MRRILPIFFLPFLIACEGGKGRELLYFHAAASLRDAVTEIASVWEERSGQRVLPIFASSSTLALQIEKGAEADLFLPANPLWADHVEAHRGVLSREELLGGRLALVCPPGNPAHIRGIADLGSANVKDIALGDPRHVPAGIYAVEWLKAAGLYKDTRKKLRPAKDVRAALSWVERREADAGLVYASDALRSLVETLDFIDPPTAIRYPLLLLEAPSGRPKAGAEALFDWLSGPEAGALFRSHGFIPLE